jgi:hypothetical protein
MTGKAVAGAVLALILSPPAWADIGPKPTMDFTFTLPASVQIRSGVLYNCEDAACANPAPLRRLGPQGFGCEATRCGARAYGFGHYFQLELTLTDGRIVKSPVTKVAGFDSRYHGVVKGQGLALTPRP